MGKNIFGNISLCLGFLLVIILTGLFFAVLWGIKLFWIGIGIPEWENPYIQYKMFTHYPNRAGNWTRFNFACVFALSPSFFKVPTLSVGLMSNHWSPNGMASFSPQSARRETFGVNIPICRRRQLQDSEKPPSEFRSPSSFSDLSHRLQATYSRGIEAVLSPPYA